MNYKTDVTAYSGLIQVDFVIKLCMILWSTICKMKHSQQLYCYISVCGWLKYLGARIYDGKTESWDTMTLKSHIWWMFYG